MSGFQRSLRLRAEISKEKSYFYARVVSAIKMISKKNISADFIAGGVWQAMELAKWQHQSDQIRNVETLFFGQKCDEPIHLNFRRRGSVFCSIS